MGTILGPALGGLLAGRSLSLPFFIAAGLSLVSLLLAWLFLPESLPAEARLAAQSSAGEGILDARLWARTIRSPIGVLFGLTFISTCGLMIFASVFGWQRSNQ